MIKLIKSSFYEEGKTKKEIISLIKRAKIFSMNKQCRKFEIKFAKKQKRKYAVFVSSGSMANLVLIQSMLNLNILKKGDKVGVSSLTWATNIMPLIQLGLEPVLIDCELDNLNISNRILENVIRGQKIKSLFITNVLGFCADLNKIKNTCKKNKILLLEDNCESLGSSLEGKLLGNFGHASTFSFFVGHHLSTIEGGMICTDNKKIYEMLVMIRAHGWARDITKGAKAKLKKKFKINDFYNKYTFYDLAYNARPTEINGFIGNTQIKYWNKIISKRVDNFKKFNKAAKNNSDILDLDLEHMDIVSNFAYPVIFKNKKLFKKYKNKFEKYNIEIRPIIAGNISHQPFYKKYVKNNNKNKCKNSELIHKQGFYFGNNPEMTKKEINIIKKALEK